MSREAGGPFEIGLVMAGAVSGGAYTAGVLDFLVEAVDAWYAAMAADPQGKAVPRHQILLKAMSGASAGSMSAAILATALGYQFPHIRLQQDQAGPQATGNPLYEAWVNSVDIGDLLEIGDLKGRIDYEPSHRLMSLLNSRKIDATVADVLNVGGVATPRAWVASNLPVLLAVGNLRGVPYGIPLRGAEITAHPMMRHGDHMAFSIMGAGSGNATKVGGDFFPLERPNGAKAWQKLGDAAMASGAFPFALRPRRLQRNPQDYDSRVYLEAGDCRPRGSAYQEIMPNWAGPKPEKYNFLCMDGGIMNNEPLELVRALLTDLQFERNPRKGSDAHRAVVMLDPFVDPVTFGPDAELPLHRLVMPLLGAWKSQCRFKPEDLALADKDDIYSRFLIAPKRDYGPTDTTHALCAGGLGAFLGFFHRAFRCHDYQLGRRNAQQFLRKHFTLPNENQLFAMWSPAVRAQWLAKPAYQDGHLPIVPLVGSCDTIEEAPLQWPKGACDPDRLRDAIAQRLSLVFDAMKDDIDADIGTRVWLNVGWWFAKGKLVDKAMTSLKGALEQQQL